MIIKVQNLLDQTAQFTYIAHAEVTGSSTIHVKNANNFAAVNWAIQVGKTGEELSEIRVLSGVAPSGTSLTVGTAFSFDHPTDTPVYAIKYDKLIWLRSTAGTSGTATAFATSNIAPDSDVTAYDDTTGLTTYAYKVAWYNSVLDGTSSQSDWLTPTGYDFYSLAAMRRRVKDKLFSTSYLGEDYIIDDWINEYMELMTNAAIDVNADYNLGSVNVAFSGSNELGTIGTADFKQVRRAWYTDNGSDYAVMQKMESITPRPNQIYNSTNPYFYMYNEDVMARWPHETAGTAAVLYYKLTPVLSNETDCLPMSMRGYTKGFVDYALSWAKRKDGKTDEANALESSAMAHLDRFKRELTPRNKTGTGYIDIVETVSEDVGDFGYRV
jgi:hypothetical protein